MTAYTSVTAQRKLGGGTLTSTMFQTPTPQPKKPTQWPPGVRDYVQRSFADENFGNGIEKEDVERKLKEVINDAAAQNQLERNWKEVPLPHILIRRERAAFASNQFISPPPSDTLTPTEHSGDKFTSKKRKSIEDPMDIDESTLPPWKRKNQKLSLSERMTRESNSPSKRDRKFDSPSKPSKYQTPSDLEKRRQRFHHELAYDSSTTKIDDDTNITLGPVVGTCQDLEKRYLRLTAAPKQETVRPLHILEKTLDHLKKKWRAESNYLWVCDQFKSLRQDLTVQHIKTEFTVNVYEIHARIALEKGDMGEYNQCQSQLKALYKQGLGGHPAEFLAYRILYLLYTKNTSDMNDVLADLTDTDKSQKAVKHAMAVRSAIALSNYHRFFRLYLETPNMGAYLMDMFVERERLAAMACICRAYKPHVPVRFLTEELGFESDPECVQFLIDRGAEQLLEESEGSVRFLSGKAANHFHSRAEAARRKVDIKGQL